MQCNHKFDGEKKCATPHLTDKNIQTAFISAFNQLFQQKDSIITSLTSSIALVFDLTPLQAQEDELIEEVQMLADAVEKCIYENAHVAQDQNEYQKKYDSLSAKYHEAKAKLDTISKQIADKKARRSTIDQFLKTLKKQNSTIDKFQQNIWCGMIDHITVYIKEDIRGTFKNSIEIKA